MSLVFPTLSRGEDARFFGMSQEDPAMRTKVEGGYVFTRPRFTRRPRRSFTTGFTNISDADRALLENFWNDTKGGSSAFAWTHPFTNEVIQVRFKKGFDFSYVGIGHSHRWDVTGIELEEV